MTRFCKALLATFVLIPLGAVAQLSSGANPTAPGIHQLTLPDSGRRYTLAIPDGYTGEAPTPLILSLHYGGTVTPFFGRGLLQGLIEPALRDLGAIIVAPDSAAGNWANPTAEQHVLELLDYIAAHYNIDTHKTLIAGYSMGGAGAWYLAPRHPERFKAALILAGRPQSDSADFDWQTPVYAIHSTNDDVVPIDSAEATIALLRARGAPIEFVVVDGLTHYAVPSYRPYVAAAIPWIEQAWAE